MWGAGGMLCQEQWLGFAHRFRPTYPDFLHGAPPTAACAAFIKESRMKFANARKLDRKSGVRSGERGAPVLTSSSVERLLVPVEWGCAANLP
jgi:hypothetical protein